jgi:glycosyltransferase involved in cell wall biosynthesis
MKICLFTRAFPYGAEESFLEYEIAILSKLENLEITIIPREVFEVIRPIPQNVTVDNSYAAIVMERSEKKIFPLISSIIKISRAVIAHRNFSISAIRDVASFVHYGVNVRKWAANFLTGKEILYTYWCDVEAFGLTSLKKEQGFDHVLISRVHGFDIYEENRPHGFIPFRQEVLKSIDKVFCISQFGVDYFKEKYDFNSALCARLGVWEPEEIALKSEDGIIRIVSCSSLAQVKRVHLIISSIIFMAQKNQGKEYEWIHIGGSPDEINKMLSEDIPDNLKIELKGQLRNEEVHTYYRLNFVDAFVNLSKSEGIPVSMMEAMSYGIPVVGTLVGGVPEIINASNGALVGKNPTNEEVCEAFEAVFSDPNKRKEAIATFEKKFDAEKNFHQFAKELMKLKE